MLQTKARKITEESVIKITNNYIEKCSSYVRKITNTKIYRKALKGFSEITIKVPKKYRKLTIIDKFQELGYTTVAKEKGKIIIKW